MANFIETFLTIREYDFMKTGTVEPWIDSYISTEKYEVNARETLRGLPLLITVKTLWAPSADTEKGIKATAQNYMIAGKAIDDNDVFTELRKYL